MTLGKLPFKIHTNPTKHSKRVIRVDLLRHWSPPVAMRLGVIADRRKSYVDYLTKRYKKSNALHYEELLTLYRYAVEGLQITLDDAYHESWVKEGFRDFLLNVSPALAQVTNGKVDIDAPFSGQ